MLLAVVHDAVGDLLGDAADAHELRRRGGVDVDLGGGQVVLGGRVLPQGAGRMLRRAALTAHADLELHLLQLGRPHPAHQRQVLHLLEATDVLAVLHDVLGHHSGDPGQSHQLLLGGRVDVEPLLVDQDVAEVARRAELAAVAQVGRVPGDGAVAAQVAPHFTAAAPGRCRSRGEPRARASWTPRRPPLPGDRAKRRSDSPSTARPPSSSGYHTTLPGRSPDSGEKRPERPDSTPAPSAPCRSLSPAPLPPRAPSAARAPPAGVVVRCELPPPGRWAVPATPHRLPGRAEPVPRMGSRATPWPGLRGVLEACVPPYALGERPCLSPLP